MSTTYNGRPDDDGPMTRRLPDDLRRRGVPPKLVDALGMTELAIAIGPQHADVMRAHLNQILTARGFGVFERAKLLRTVDPLGAKGGDTEARRQAFAQAFVETADKLRKQMAKASQGAKADA